MTDDREKERIEGRKGTTELRGGAHVVLRPR